MGFSVSGSAAIVFVGLFIAFGMWQTAATNSFERVTDAQQAHSDDVLAQQNTAIAIDGASYTTKNHNGQTWYLIDLGVNNTGSTSLSIRPTDVLIDNDYETGWGNNATVDGDPDTELWLPGEQLFVEFNESSQPTRVKVTSETGVSDSTEVTGP
jgi:flagellar protein FlaF